MSRGKKTRVSKTKTKDTTKKKQGSPDQQKCEEHNTQSISGASGLNIFKSDEMQEIKLILQYENLTQLPPALGAVILGRFDIVKKLLSSGANVNSRWLDGSTPLFWAVRTQNIEMAGLLLARGANPSLLDHNDLTPVQTAILSKDWDQNMFLDFWNLIKNSPDMIFDVVDVNGNNLLHQAVERQWPALIELLLEKQVPIDQENKIGVTPLLRATECNFSSCAAVLIEAGASVIHEDSRGRTPFCCAVAAFTQRRQGSRQILQNLIDSINSSDNTTYIEVYLKRRLELLISLQKNDASLEKNLITVLEFFLRQIETGLELLLELDVFEKIYLALERRTIENTSPGPLLRLTSALLLRCDCCGGDVHNHLPTNAFISSGVADICLRLLDGGEYKYMSNIKCAAALIPIALAVTASSKAALWAREHRIQLAAHCKSYMDICLSAKDMHIDHYHKQILKYKLKKFQGMIFQWENPDLESDEFSLNLDIDQKSISPMASLSPHSKDDPSSSGSETVIQLDSCINGVKQKCVNITKNNCNNRIQSSSLNTTPRKSNRNTKVRTNRQKRDSTSERVLTISSASTVLINNSLYGESEHNTSQSECSLRLVKSNPPSLTLLEYDNKKYCRNNEPIDSNLYSENSEKELLQKRFENENTIGDVLKTSDENSLDAFFSYFATNDENLMALNKKDSDYAHINELRSIEREILKSSEILNVNGVSTQKGMKIDHYRALKTDEQEHRDVLKNEHPNDNWDFKSSHFVYPFNTEDKICELDSIFHQIILKYQNFWNKDKEEGYPGFKGCRGDNSFTALFGLTFEEQLSNLKKELPKLEEAYINQLTEEWCNIIKMLRSNVFSDPSKCIECFTELENILLSHEVRNTSIAKVNIEKTNCSNNDKQLLPIFLDNESSVLVEKSCERLLNMMNESVSNTSTINIEIFHKSVVEELENKHYMKYNQSYNEYQIDYNKLTSNRNCVIGNSNPPHSRWRMLLDAFLATPRMQTSIFSVSTPENRGKFIISVGGNFGDVELAFGNNGLAMAIKHIPISIRNSISVGLQNICNLSHPHVLTPIVEGSILAAPLCEYNLGELLMCLKVEGKYIDLATLAKQLILGLVHLHSTNIIHGNLKPSNVLIDNTGVLKLSEFGFHKTLYQNNRPPKSSMIWFARETLEDWEKSNTFGCDSRSDIQVSGMLLHFLLSGGQHPLGMAADDILDAIRGGTAPSILSPALLADLLNWMLAHKPPHRPTATQALGHMYFWSCERQWQLVESCAGLGPTPAPVSLLAALDAVPASHTALGDWVSLLSSACPEILKDCHETLNSSPSSLLRLVQSRRCNARTLLTVLPALPLTLLHLVAAAGWADHPALVQFTSLLPSRG